MRSSSHRPKETRSGFPLEAEEMGLLQETGHPREKLRFHQHGPMSLPLREGPYDIHMSSPSGGRSWRGPQPDGLRPAQARRVSGKDLTYLTRTTTGSPPLS
jgi:hypothetical protein